MQDLQKLQCSIIDTAERQMVAYDFDISGLIQDGIEKMCKNFQIPFVYNDWKSLVNANEIKSVENLIIEVFRKKLADKIITDILEQITPQDDDECDYEDRDYGRINNHTT